MSVACMRRRVVIAMLVACGIALPLLASWLRGAAAVRLDVAPVRLQRLAPSVLAAGVLAYTSQVTLTPQVLGRVQAIRVAEGQQVRAGDAAVLLDAHDAGAEVAQFVAAQSQARIDVQRDERESEYRRARASRYGELRAQGMVTALQYDELVHAEETARLQLQNSRQALLRAAAQLAQAREALAKTDIRAPIDGQVSAIEARVGETVVPGVNNVAGSVLLTISNPAERLAEVEVDETDVAAVRPGQPARVFVAADPDRPLAATVQKIAVMPVQQPRGRVYRTRLRLADADTADFRPGMGCRAEIFVGQPGPVLAVPQQAVLSEDDAASGGAHVFVVAGGVAHRRAIDVGRSDDTAREVTAGVSTADVVAIGPARVLRALRDGDRVETAVAR